MRVPRLSRPLLFPVLLATVAITLLNHGAARAAGGHGADLLPVLAIVVLMLVGGKLGGSLFASMKQSPVLGELLAGVVFGNLGLLGFHELDAARDLPSIDLLAQIGVLFLLFEVGIASNVEEMMKVGVSSLLVAIVGVVSPIVLGYFTSAFFFPSHNVLTHWFVGATLCATSVGITARVLTDLGKTKSKEGRIILGAAVIDDVLGLIVLAVVAGIIEAADSGRAFHASTILMIVGKSLVFLVGAFFIGRWLSRHAFRIATRMRGEGLLLTLALVFCFGLSYLAGVSGLAPIVGAFAAGLILDEVHYRELRDADRRKRDIHELLEPLSTFLVPIFFVLMGMRVDLSVFGAVEVLGFAAVLTLAAVAGKQACGLAVIEKGADRFAIGLGMIPRGEVGLIFAGVGASLTIAGERVVDGAVFSAVIVMVALTTFMTPPLMVWRMRQSETPRSKSKP